VHRGAVFAQGPQHLEGHSFQSKDGHHVAHRRDDPRLSLACSAASVTALHDPIRAATNPFCRSLEGQCRCCVTAYLAGNRTASHGFSDARKRAGKAVDIARLVDHS
jgi:hypothetical protein